MDTLCLALTRRIKRKIYNEKNKGILSTRRRNGVRNLQIGEGPVVPPKKLPKIPRPKPAVKKKAASPKLPPKTPRKKPVIPASHKKITPNILDGPVVWEIQLPLPPGLNSTYASRVVKRRGRMSSLMYKTKVAKDWNVHAVHKMREAGWGQYPSDQLFWITVYYEIFTISMDVDGPEKLIIDSVKEVINIDDRWVAKPEGLKSFATSRTNQYMNLIVRIDPVESKLQFNQLTKQHSEQGRAQLYEGVKRDPGNSE